MMAEYALMSGSGGEFGYQMTKLWHGLVDGMFSWYGLIAVGVLLLLWLVFGKSKYR